MRSSKGWERGLLDYLEIGFGREMCYAVTVRS